MFGCVKHNDIIAWPIINYCFNIRWPCDSMQNLWLLLIIEGPRPGGRAVLLGQL